MPGPILARSNSQVVTQEECKLKMSKSDKILNYNLQHVSQRSLFLKVRLVRLKQLCVEFCVVHSMKANYANKTWEETMGMECTNETAVSLRD